MARIPQAKLPARMKEWNMPTLRLTRHRRKRALLLRGTVALCACSLALSACGRGSTGSGGGSSGGSAKTLVIGWSQRGISGSDWWKTLIAGGQYEAKKLGVTLKVLDANRDTTQQVQDVQTLMNEGVGVVIMNANDPIGVASAVHSLKKASVPLVEVNSNLSSSLVPDTFCYVAENQVATGALVGRQIATKAIARYGTHATVKFVAIGGYPGDVITELRYRGFMQGYKSVMSKYPHFKTTVLPIRYGHWLPDQALSPIRDVATANPDLKIIFSESDVMQAGIQQALQQAGLWKKGILEGSYDGGMNSIQELAKDPNGPLQADGSNQPWDQGVAAVQMAVAAHNHNTAACPTKTNYIKTTLVTPANAETYYKPAQTYVRAASGQETLTHG
jgi:ribose transport system substrate-binding protein